MLGVSAAQGPSGLSDTDRTQSALDDGPRTRTEHSRRTRDSADRVDGFATLVDGLDVRRFATLDERRPSRLTEQFREEREWAETHSTLVRAMGTGWLNPPERAQAGIGRWGSGSAGGWGFSGASSASASRRDGSPAWTGSGQQSMGGSVMPVATAANWSRTFGFTPYSQGSGAPRGTDALGESADGNQAGVSEGLRPASVQNDVPAPATALLLAIGLLAWLSRRNCGPGFR